MINRTNLNQPNFTSTFVPKYAKMPLQKASEELSKYFEVKGFGNNLSPAKIREKIDLSQAGISMQKDGFIVAGKDREADEFIARTLRKDNLFVTYKQDTPETIFDDNVIDLTI